MSIEIRRTLTLVQTTYEEGGKAVPVPTKLVSAMAIVKNPWFGCLRFVGIRLRAAAKPVLLAWGVRSSTHKR